ncbi:MAG: acyl carrier protein [Magnetococcales bacterium]|nr:acyl carrier protein [Magnetococcales bacterium]
MRESILHRLRPIIHEIFKDPTIVVTEELTMNDVPAWDSIGHIALITATEKAFNIQCSLSELVNVESVGALAILVEKKLSI